jgi:hypothetical protein
MYECVVRQAGQAHDRWRRARDRHRRTSRTQSRHTNACFHTHRLSSLGPAQQLDGGSSVISASSFWILCVSEVRGMGAHSRQDGTTGLNQHLDNASLRVIQRQHHATPRDCRHSPLRAAFHNPLSKLVLGRWLLAVLLVLLVLLLASCHIRRSRGGAASGARSRSCRRPCSCRRRR